MQQGIYRWARYISSFSSDDPLLDFVLSVGFFGDKADTYLFSFLNRLCAAHGLSMLFNVRSRSDFDLSKLGFLVVQSFYCP